jgi:ABC-type transporter MlaC component
MDLEKEGGLNMDRAHVFVERITFDNKEKYKFMWDQIGQRIMKKWYGDISDEQIEMRRESYKNELNEAFDYLIRKYPPENHPNDLFSVFIKDKNLLVDEAEAVVRLQINNWQKEPIPFPAQTKTDISVSPDENKKEAA